MDQQTQSEISIDEATLTEIADNCGERGVNWLKHYKIESSDVDFSVVTMTFSNASINSISYLAGKVLCHFVNNGFDVCPHIIESGDEIIWTEGFNNVDIHEILFLCNSLILNHDVYSEPDSKLSDTLLRTGDVCTN